MAELCSRPEMAWAGPAFGPYCVLGQALNGGPGIGWSDYEKYATHSMLCQIVVRPQFQNFMS